MAFETKTIVDNAQVAVIQYNFAVDSTDNHLDSTMIFDISAAFNVKGQKAKDTVWIEGIILDAALDASTKIYLTDSEHNIITVLTNAHSGAKKHWYGEYGLQGTTELDTSATGDLYIAVGNTLNQSSGDVTGTVSAGGAFTLQLRLRKRIKPA